MKMYYGLAIGILLLLAAAALAVGLEDVADISGGCGGGDDCEAQWGCDDGEYPCTTWCGATCEGKEEIDGNPPTANYGCTGVAGECFPRNYDVCRAYYACVLVECCCVKGAYESNTWGARGCRDDE